MQNNSTSKAIPAWLLAQDDKKNIMGSIRVSFLQKTIKELSAVIQNEVYSQRYTNKKGYLQMADPRVKLITLFVFMLLCATAHSIITLVLLAAVAACFTVLSRLSLISYIKRVWLIVPVLVFIISIPAATNLFTSGTPLFYIYKPIVDSGLYITQPGILIITKMALRIGNSISFGYLLIMTTTWAHITMALSVFKVPALITTILGMTYRYIYILSKLATDLMVARFLRTVGSTDNKSNRGFMANRLSFLFLKASFISEELYAAMRCRGFSGKPLCLERFKLKATDILWVVNIILLIIILIVSEVIN